MGADTRTVGGGAATPLGNDLAGLFRYLITGEAPGSTGVPAGTGGFYMKHPGEYPQYQPGATSPTDQTSLIMGGINRLLSGVDLSGTGQALEQMIQQQTEQGVSDLRARFGASGGVSHGTPAAVGEARFRAEQAPKTALALGQLNLQKAQVEAGQILPLLQIIAALAGKGIPQATTVVQPDFWSTLAGFLPGAAQGTASIIKAV